MEKSLTTGSTYFMTCLDYAKIGREYSDIPLEMKETAAVPGAGHLGETSSEKLLENLPAITNDRAALHAFHFLRKAAE